MYVFRAVFSMIRVMGMTNHNLQTTAASQMFQAGIPKKNVQEHTGHCSVTVLRMYEGTTTSQHTKCLKYYQQAKKKQMIETPSLPTQYPGLFLTSVFGKKM